MILSFGQSNQAHAVVIPPRRPTNVLSVAGSGSQYGFQVLRSPTGTQFFLETCAGRAPCSQPTSHIPLPVPPELRHKLQQVHAREIPLAPGKSAVMLTIDPSGSGSNVWVAVVAAPKAGNQVVQILYAEEAAVATSPWSRTGHAIEVRKMGKYSQIIKGERRIHTHLCGRAGMVKPQLLDPSDFKWKSAKFQRLQESDLTNVEELSSVKRSGIQAPPLGKLLKGIGKSGGHGAAHLVTDGNLDTVWSESRGAEGYGEFLTLQVPKVVPLTSLSMVVRPKSEEVEHGASPKHFWLVTDHKIFGVTVPEDGWKTPGAAFDITFPKAIQTSCVAIVLDTAYAPKKDARKMRVTISELEARSSLDGQKDYQQLSVMLAGNDENASIAREILMRAGQKARDVVADRYSLLPDRGRLFALDIIDQGPCSKSAFTYMKAFSSRFELEHERGETLLEQCKEQALPALKLVVEDPKNEQQMAAAELLARMLPAQALPLLMSPNLPSKTSRKVRAEWRNRLFQSAQSPLATEALAKLLGNDALPVETRLSLLRATDNRASEQGLRVQAGQAMAKVLRADPSFRSKYLLMPVVGALANQNNPEALALWKQALNDSDKELRAAAVRAAEQKASLVPMLLPLVKDPQPRVREALALALVGQSRADAQQTLASLFADPWTFVRVASYASLAGSPNEASVDQRMVDRLLKEQSPSALASLLESVGARKILSASKSLRKIIDNEQYLPSLRARSAEALGGICDQTSEDYLLGLVRKGSVPGTSGAHQMVGSSALSALIRLNPPGLKAKLTKIWGNQLPPGANIALQQGANFGNRCR
jgi:HEAT repeat protein